MKKTTIMVAMLFACSTLLAQNTADKFVKTNIGIVQSLSKAWGIPASVILGVALHESANGTSRNARELNNFFGIKGSNNLTHRRSAYKAFESVSHAFEFFCGMLSRKKFYPNLKGEEKPEKWLAAMEKSGYAEAGDWKPKINNIIAKQNLKLYDNL